MMLYFTPEPFVDDACTDIKNKIHSPCKIS